MRAGTLIYHLFHLFVTGAILAAGCLLIWMHPTMAATHWSERIMDTVLAFGSFALVNALLGIAAHIE